MPTVAAALGARHFSKANPDDVHAKLKELATSRSAADVEIGEWLVAADDLELHRSWGFGSIEQYALRMFGWDARAVRDRLRVARKLETLPLLRDRMLDGRMNWSVAREISRVAESKDIEAEWVEKTEGKTARQVAQMVLGLEKDARPGSKKNPDLITHRRTFELTSEELAILEGFLRESRAHSDESMTDGKALIRGITNKQAQSGDSGASRHQIAFVKRVGDETLYVSTSEGPLPVRPEVTERIECDAITIPATVDGEIAGRASQSIPPSHKRQVALEAGGMCEALCGRHMNDVHHSKFRKDGGTHQVKFLVGLCWGCHGLVHEGFLRIEGDREQGFRFFQANGRPFGSMIGRPSVLSAIADAVQGFNRLGCKDPDARRLAEDAAKELYAEGKSITGEAVFERGLRARGRAYKMKPVIANPAPPAHVSQPADAEASARANAEVAHVCHAKESNPANVPSTEMAHVCQNDVRSQSAPATTNVGDVIGDAISGLRNLGYRESDARTYVELALSSFAGMPSVEELVAAALRMRGQALLAREGTGGGESTTAADPFEYRVPPRVREPVDV